MIRSWVEEGVGRVHLDDAEHRNVLSLEHSREIAAAIDAFADVGAIVLTAADPVFCSGGVLDDLIEPAGAADRRLRRLRRPARSATVPTIAVVTGPAIGAGVNLPLACDIVIAGTSAACSTRGSSTSGCTPAAATCSCSQQRVGRQGAAALSLCGDRLTGPEAERAGLAWRCLPDDEAEALRPEARPPGRRARPRADAAGQGHPGRRSPATHAGGVRPRAGGPAVVDGPTRLRRPRPGPARPAAEAGSADVHAALERPPGGAARPGARRRRRPRGDHDRGAAAGRRPGPGVGRAARQRAAVVAGRRRRHPRAGAVRRGARRHPVGGAVRRRRRGPRALARRARGRGGRARRRPRPRRVGRNPGPPRRRRRGAGRPGAGPGADRRPQSGRRPVRPATRPRPSWRPHHPNRSATPSRVAMLLLAADLVGVGTRRARRRGRTREATAAVRRPGRHVPGGAAHGRRRPRPARRRPQRPVGGGLATRPRRRDRGGVGAPGQGAGGRSGTRRLRGRVPDVRGPRPHLGAPGLGAPAPGTDVTGAARRRGRAVGGPGRPGPVEHAGRPGRRRGLRPARRRHRGRVPRRPPRLAGRARGRAGRRLAPTAGRRRMGRRLHAHRRRRPGPAGHLRGHRQRGAGRRRPAPASRHRPPGPRPRHRSARPRSAPTTWPG